MLGGQFGVHVFGLFWKFLMEKPAMLNRLLAAIKYTAWYWLKVKLVGFDASYIICMESRPGFKGGSVLR